MYRNSLVRVGQQSLTGLQAGGIPLLTPSSLSRHSVQQLMTSSKKPAPADPWHTAHFEKKANTLVGMRSTIPSFPAAAPAAPAMAAARGYASPLMSGSSFRAPAGSGLLSPLSAFRNLSSSPRIAADATTPVEEPPASPIFKMAAPEKHRDSKGHFPAMEHFDSSKATFGDVVARVYLHAERSEAASLSLLHAAFSKAEGEDDFKAALRLSSFFRSQQVSTTSRTAGLAISAAIRCKAVGESLRAVSDRKNHSLWPGRRGYERLFARADLMKPSDSDSIFSAFRQLCVDVNGAHAIPSRILYLSARALALTKNPTHAFEVLNIARRTRDLQVTKGAISAFLHGKLLPTLPPRPPTVDPKTLGAIPVSIYNTVVRAYVDSGNMAKARECLDLIKKDSVEFSTKTSELESTVDSSLDSEKETKEDGEEDKKE